MSLREWLILIGILVIVVVMVDGYRRMRLAKKRATELNFGLEEVKGYDDALSELPNGGARARPLNETLSRKEHPRERVEPGFSSTRESDPPTESLQPDPSSIRRRQSSLNTTNDVESDASGQSMAPDDQLLDEQSKVATNTCTFPQQGSERSVTVAPPRERTGKKVGQAETAKASRQNREVSSQPSPNKTMPVADVVGESPEKLQDRPVASEVIVINILARGGEFFAGDQLLQALLGCDLRYGDMSIFHRYANADGTGKIIFSVANGVKPGTFSIDELENTQTPALGMFMGLPGPEKPLQAFAMMEETARRLALDLGGEMKDEQLSVMTQQTLEHYRQRIRDYERKQLARQPAH